MQHASTLFAAATATLGLVMLLYPFIIFTYGDGIVTVNGKSINPIGKETVRVNALIALGIIQCIGWITIAIYFPFVFIIVVAMLYVAMNARIVWALVELHRLLKI